MGILEYVAKRITQLRSDFHNGAGISQAELAEALGKTPNTISRWETGTYKPKIEDLEQLSRFFGISILEFFPKETVPQDERMAALLRAATKLDDKDLDELQNYAEFRTARYISSHQKRPRAGRKRKNDKK